MYIWDDERKEYRKCKCYKEDYGCCKYKKEDCSCCKYKKEDCGCCKYKKYDYDCPKCYKGDKIAISCGQVCEETIDIIDCYKCSQVASLQIDLKKIKDPVVKLDFSSIIKFMDLDTGLYSAANAAFTLKLFRLTDCCEKVCIGSWKYARFYNDYEHACKASFLAATRDSFCFTKCDYPVCDDCVEYVLEVWDKTFDESKLTKLKMTSINFNAIAVSKCD
jgi:hypothetical protein